MEDALNIIQKLIASASTIRGLIPDDKRKLLKVIIDEFNSINNDNLKIALETARELKKSKSLSDWKTLKGKRRLQFIKVLESVTGIDVPLELEDIVDGLKELMVVLKKEMGENE